MRMPFHTVQGELHIPYSSKLFDNSWERNLHGNFSENMIIQCTLHAGVELDKEDDYWSIQDLLENFMTFSAEDPKNFMVNVKLDENGFDIEFPMKAGKYDSMYLITLNTENRNLLATLRTNYAYHLGVEFAEQMAESKKLKGDEK